MTQNQIDVEATAIARRYRALAEQIAAAQEEQKALQARFRNLVPVGYALEVDGKAVSKSGPARRFDAVTAVQVARNIGLPIRYLEPAVDVADLRKRLEVLDAIDACMVPGQGAEIVRLG